jgi:hypothetical protein
MPLPPVQLDRCGFTQRELMLSIISPTPSPVISQNKTLSASQIFRCLMLQFPMKTKVHISYESKTKHKTTVKQIYGRPTCVSVQHIASSKTQNPSQMLARALCTRKGFPKDS